MSKEGNFLWSKVSIPILSFSTKVWNTFLFVKLSFFGHKIDGPDSRNFCIHPHWSCFVSLWLHSTSPKCIFKIQIWIVFKLTCQKSFHTNFSRTTKKRSNLWDVEILNIHFGYVLNVGIYGSSSIYKNILSGP